MPKNNASGQLVWTPERDDVLRRLIDDGSTVSRAAEVLGTSRSAVAGRMSRLKIRSKNPQHGGRNGTGGSRKARRPAAPRVARQNPRMAGVLAAPKAKGGQFGTTNIIHRVDTRAKAAAFVDRPAPVTEQPPRMVALADLGRTDCRWPIGDPLEPSFGFCGLVREPGESYCLHHVRLAYQTPRVAA